MQVLVSWNIREITDPVKRQAMFTTLKQFSPSIICLQETHLNIHKLHFLKHAQDSRQYHSIYTTYSRGVSIMIANDVDLSCRQIKIETKGRYIFLYCTIYRKTYALANIYRICHPHIPQRFLKNC